MSEQPPQPPQPPQLQAWLPPAPPTNPYGYPPPPNPYAAPPQYPYAAPPQYPYAAPPQNPYATPPQNPYAAPAYGYPPPQRPYPAAPPNPSGYPPPSPYSYAPPPPTHRARNLVIGGIVLALVVAVIGVEATHPRTSTAASSSGHAPVLAKAPVSPSAPAGPGAPSPDGSGVTLTSPLNSTSGTVVFADNFTDPDAGWDTGTYDDSTYEYRPDGYYITSDVAAHFLSYSPYEVPAQQVSLSVTAVEAGGAKPGSGFGAICRRGPDSATQLRYEFVVTNSGEWFIERNQGDLGTATEPTILREGATQLIPAASALTVTAVCATQADGTTTRLALFTNGVKVADILDVTTLDAAGWLGGILTTNASNDPATTIFNYYNESTLGAPSLLAANT